MKIRLFLEILRDIACILKVRLTLAHLKLGIQMGGLLWLSHHTLKLTEVSLLQYMIMIWRLKLLIQIIHYLALV